MLHQVLQPGRSLLSSTKSMGPADCGLKPLDLCESNEFDHNSKNQTNTDTHRFQDSLLRSCPPPGEAEGPGLHLAELGTGRTCATPEESEPGRRV